MARKNENNIGFEILKFNGKKKRGELWKIILKEKKDKERLADR